ncbi:phosphotransferase family protein [Ligilactobacillus equi]|uniref:Phosphotransferase family protein n=2 Tax=Ligilactobacillus equi TaxID=137357 RepID=V7HUK0_9LACO|nr:phosphotransferase family protein [Ligilactobacillus equi]ETA73874.1 phosphotransferase family protein [Ligilactobacillus equi DPC 6820]KRL77196.1 phosphotransferase family protein [Ligilactobacillus equi DSM 15833 = JCM 10991]MCQ2557124.1 phosphotransferase family protein [Ligilactobacillus sp.]
MVFTLGKDWQVEPIAGDTGTAFMGTNKEEKLFLKQNTSPFLAALAIEEITPRLVWAKRLVSGDTITAQEWKNGRSLHKSEMTQKSVAELLHRIHHLPVLKKILGQIGGKTVTPFELLNQYFRGLNPQLRSHPLLKDVANRLRSKQPNFARSNYEVCHGDLNHKNWLLSDHNQLYLVDWESALIADPALDLSMLMYHYVPRENWQEWLTSYYALGGEELPPDLEARVHWYVLMRLLLNVKDAYERGRFHEMNQDIIKLSQVLNEQSLL